MITARSLRDWADTRLRFALGLSRRRFLRQRMIELVILAAFGGVGAEVLMSIGCPLVASLVVPHVPDYGSAMDARNATIGIISIASAGFWPEHCRSSDSHPT